MDEHEIELGAERQPADGFCPRCMRPCPEEERVKGVCPACLRLLRSTVKLATEEVTSDECPVTSNGHAGGASFDENSQRISTTADSGMTESWMEGFCQRHGYSQQTALDLIADVESRRNESAGEESLLAVRDALITTKDLIERGFIQVQAYEKNNGDRVLAERVMWLLLGFHTLAGADSLPSLVTLMGFNCTKPSHWTSLKARVNKCLQFFQSQVPELPILPGQRSEEARREMSLAQKIIWSGSVAPTGHWGGENTGL